MPTRWLTVFGVLLSALLATSAWAQPAEMDIYSVPSQGLFKSNRTELVDTSDARLQSLLATAKRAIGPLEISVHTDSRGSDVYNGRLSTKRAFSVAPLRPCVIWNGAAIKRS